jgi:hypothetical protein
MMIFVKFGQGIVGLGGYNMRMISQRLRWFDRSFEKSGHAGMATTSQKWRTEGTPRADEELQ